MSKPGNESSLILQKIRQERASGKIYKRFEDEFYALDLLKILYDDSIDNSIKVELLINLEEYGSLGITEESIDQIVTSLLDIQHQLVDQGDNWPVVCQILETCTSLLVQFEQQVSDLCKTVVKELVSIVTSKVNQPDSHRLRSCACQCLIHLEEFQQGLLLNYCDDFCELARQERTDVFQDYALLAAKVLSSAGSFSGKAVGLSEQGIQNKVQKQISYEPQDVRQIVAFLVENIAVYTRSGTFRIVECLSSLVKSKPEVSPMVFKPPMLHQMSTMSCVILHTVLHLQHEFKGEILSEQEEYGLIQRLCYMTDHPSLNMLHRLLASQWAQMYSVHGSKTVPIHPSIKQKHRLIFYPTVFDSIDSQLRKLYMTAVCGDTKQDIDGVETSILLGSLGCLHKMVWHTGSGLAARALFKALYFIYTYHNNNSFSADIQRFVRGLISEFAHFIPHSIDFADSINALDIDRQVYVDTLILLHQQVVMATEEQICHSFHFYLEIMKKAGAHVEIDPKPTLKFLTYLAENAEIIDDNSWKLGHGILDICRNIIICHGTQLCFLELGDLLYYMMLNYSNTDVQDKARFYYALITGATDNKVHSVLKTNLSVVQSMTEAITSLLPGTNDKVSLAQIIPLDDPVFCWQRISVESSTQRLETKDLSSEGNEGVNEGILQQYETNLKNLEVNLQLRCHLKLREQSKFKKVHAVSILVETSPSFQNIPNKHIACLTGSGHQDVGLKVVPKLPLPLTLNCSVEFSSDSKQTFSTIIDPLYVEFSHLLMKMQWTSCDIQHLKFSTVWDWVLSRKIGDEGGVESVKIFTISVEKFKQVHEKHLSHFLYTGKKENDWCYAIFLPPCYHVLLKCRSTSSDCVVVSIATDLWTVLSHVDTYLNEIIK